MGFIDGAEEVAPGRYDIELDGRLLKVSNPDRVLFPQTGFSKADLINYYVNVAPALLPHLADRPVTLRRFPGGVESPGFWEKHCAGARPDWVKTASVESSSGGDTVDYCLVDEAATLVWLANLAGIEIHTSLAAAAGRDSPDSVVFDLDPGEPAGLVECAHVAMTIAGTLEQFGLRSLVKTSGSKGLQMYVPLNTGASYEETKPFARTIARALESEMPDLVVSSMKKRVREGKILVDWSQNSVHKTTVSVYSIRARPDPSVSSPVGWDEVESVLDSRDASELIFGPEDVLMRIAERGEIFGQLLTLRQELPSL